MNIGYYPITNNANRYIDISKSCIEAAGNSIVDFNELRYENMDDVDCVILNWYESVPSNKSIKILYHIALRVRKILQLKMKHVKIITTFHNKKPHDINNKISEKMIKIFYKWLLKNSNKIIVLSNNSKNYLLPYLSPKEIRKKTFLIPHPNYIGEEKSISNLGNKSPKEFKLLFIGQIRPYKNIETLIDAIKDLADYPIYLVVAGSPSNEEYRHSLLNRTETSINSNISFDFRFIPEEEMSNLFNNASITVLPYDIQSSMNSGTVILSFSNGKTVICPRISTLSDFDESLYYSYSYTNNADHKEQLKETIMRAYRDWKNNSSNFESKGMELYEIVKKNNSKDQLVKCYKRLFDSI